uniref:Seven TM Receptor n=1 Tax=Caenorhabditis tropicalis TaxID=1561998 RepID=A0A1I7U9I5_9PELO
MFNGIKSIVWIIYPMLPGASYSISFYFFCLPDEYSDNYVRSDILDNYGLDISEVPRFIVLPYDINGVLRVKNLFLLVSGVSMIGFHYFVMLYCGLKMHFNMKKELKKFSATQRKLQKQFFYALVVQSLGPTVFLVLPAVPILLSPLIPPSMEIEISWQTGWLYTLVGLYPPFDSIGFMIIVTEYKKVIRNQITFLMSDNPSHSTTLSTVNSHRTHNRL